MTELSGRVAIITGASRGIGFSLAHHARPRQLSGSHRAAE